MPSCPQRAVLLPTASLLGFLLLGYGYFWLLVPEPDARLQQLGLFCSIFTISMYLSPLADLVSWGWEGRLCHQRLCKRRAQLPPRVRDCGF